MLETILFAQKNQVATISFNRPNNMNSFNKTMAYELEKVTDEVRNDDSIRVLLLNGAGNLFMAGGDIHFFQEKIETMPEGVMDITRKLNNVIINLMHMPKPVVASVHGSAAGVGMSFMMACDLVIAANNTKFTMAYSGLGISPDGGSSFNLPQIVGKKKAMQWLLLSEIFPAQEALEFGLINWVVTPEKLVEETQKLVLRLANGPTKAQAKIKRLVNHMARGHLESHLELEARAFVECSQTEDFKNGVLGFLNKKQPTFIGN